MGNLLLTYVTVTKTHKHIDAFKIPQGFNGYRTV